MFKKIIFWLFYLIFVGGLIWGAINRTSAVLETDDKNTNTDLSTEIIGAIFKTATPPAENTQDIGVAEQTISTITPENHQESETRERAWEILRGNITTLSNRGATIMLENGSFLSINPRAWRFALEQGLQAQMGDALLLTGFYEEEGKFEIAHLRSLANETVAQIRDEGGHPLWTSGGNGE